MTRWSLPGRIPRLGPASALFASALLALATARCGGPVEPGPGVGSATPGRPVTRYIDLLRRYELGGVADRSSVGIEVWSLDGDSRAVLFLESPERLEVGPLRLRGRCVLRFGIAIRERHWERTEGVEFRVSVVHGDGRSERVFQELLRPADLPGPAWLDREVPLPAVADGTASVLFETEPGPGGDSAFDDGGWSSPHLVCEGERIALPEAEPGAPPSVLLISIDTLRRDHLGLYGYQRPTSPALDRFAREAVVFEHCFSPAPYTLPSHASLLTGLPPSRHRAGFDFPWAPLATEVPTLAERFQAAGYRTVAVTAEGLVSRLYGLARGFDEWRELRRANLPSVLPSVFDVLLETSDRPLFLFLHTYDVHGPYRQPEGFRFFSADVEAESDPEAWQRIVDMPYHKYQKLDRFRNVGEVVAAYDSSVRFVDSQLDRLFRYMEEIGVRDRFVIVVTSDHGEALFEAQRYFGHTHTLEDRELRVPLLIRVPGGTAAGRRTGLVELADVAPTLLRLTGVEGSEELPGVVLLPDGDRPAVERKYVLGGSSHLGAVSVRTLGAKLISPPSRGWRQRLALRFGAVGERFSVDWQLYDLVQDPEERRNLYGVESGAAEDLRPLMAALRGAERPGRSTEQARETRERRWQDREAAERLRALGYLQ